MSSLSRFYSRHEKAIGVAVTALSLAFCTAIAAGVIPGAQTRSEAVQAAGNPEPSVKPAPASRQP